MLREEGWGCCPKCLLAAENSDSGVPHTLKESVEVGVGHYDKFIINYYCACVSDNCDYSFEYKYEL